MEAKKLLIVESPAKAKTIGKYLGDDFLVKASVGHVRDLPRKSVAVKIAPDAKHKGDWTFSPCYEISADKKKIVEELRKAAKASSEIYLAPDPDREGEAIAWHLKTVLESAAKGKPFHRVTYNEITRNAVMAAVANPGEIDLRRVDAQQARRILDRLVGYKVSPLLWKHLNYGYTLSAGRVQSVALRLLVERQREIDSFTPVAYWVMGVEAKKGSGPKFTARLARIDGEKASVTDEQQSMMILGDLDQVSLSVRDVKSTQRTRHPMPPFTTSSLQQAASSVCGFSPKVTMGLAQKLYEEGLITYMRTDSVNIAAVARDAARKLISEKYGAEFTPEKPNFYKSKGGAQEAHEAIRPTDVAQEPGSIKLDAKSAKLYDLIWRRFVASQMSDARLSLRTVVISADRPGICHDYEFTASATSVDFEGFLKVMNKLSVKERKPEDEESDEVDSLPPLSKGDALTAVRWISDRKETKPPPHYSEAALVKALEENGVGRPSTYAATVETLVTRQYAERMNRQLLPTQRGMDVNDWLVKKLDSLFAVDYTAKMEEELDEIEEGKVGFDSMLSNFYRKFAAALEAAKDPPPPTEKFDEILAVLNDVTEWRDQVRFPNVAEFDWEGLAKQQLEQLRQAARRAREARRVLPRQDSGRRAPHRGARLRPGDRLGAQRAERRPCALVLPDDRPHRRAAEEPVPGLPARAGRPRQDAYNEAVLHPRALRRRERRQPRGLRGRARPPLALRPRGFRRHRDRPRGARAAQAA